MSTALSINDVSKIYRIYSRPSDRIRELLNFRKRHKYYSTHTALKKINLEIEKGTFLGIIGKNGAGKSTLLKILSGELAPTTGSTTINGTLAMLQLGLGFNPELSGIENVEFSARLLGHDEKVIKEILQEVIDFAELGDFIHHPVKTYSSGMYSRLSFAIGTTISPDILIADEVLAVGDIRFAQKCLRKMTALKSQGKTIILVTHDIGSVNVHCDRTIWIKDGEVFSDGDSSKVTEDFKNYMLYDRLPGELTSTSGASNTNSTSPTDILIGSQHNVIGHGLNRPISASLTDVHGQPLKTCSPGDEIQLKVTYEVEDPTVIFHIGFVMNNRLGQTILHINNDIAHGSLPVPKAGQVASVVFNFKMPPVKEAEYLLSIGAQETINDCRMLWRAHDVFLLQVKDHDIAKEQCGLVTLSHCSANAFTEDAMNRLPEA